MSAIVSAICALLELDEGPIDNILVWVATLFDACSQGLYNVLRLPGTAALPPEQPVPLLKGHGHL